ncbi:MAG TPA: lipase maturation factor family protein, partial [Bryobacteraceae bacterium]
MRWRWPAFPSVEAFLCLLGLIYFIAFTSFGVQAAGLIGSRGLSPLPEFLKTARESLGSAAYWDVPTVLWLNSRDAAIAAVWIAGAAAALAAIFTRWPRPALAVCLVLWLSVCGAGQDFLSFQWDVLLLETGFLAIFATDARLRVWLFRWLLFRLMFFSGVVKLQSHDPTWRDLTAMSYHYQTQPLPNPLSWYMYQLPLWFHKGETLFTFAAELAVPFLYFAPRRLRHIAGYFTVGLQLLILATGNYTFFNLLAIALAVFLFIEPPTAAERLRSQIVTVALTAFIGILSGLVFLQLFSLPLPPGGAETLHWTAPLRIVNSYGLFASMTTERPEIQIEGSNDGVEWKAYEFPYKPGNLRRAPPVIEPHQPRLDWQMWFAALG